MPAYVEMLDISFQDETFRYCDGGEDIHHLGHRYVAAPFTRTAIKEDGALNRLQIKVKMPWDTAPVRKIYNSPRHGPISLRLYRTDVMDPSRRVSLLWFGRVQTCTRAGVEAELSCAPGDTSSDPEPLRRMAQRGCPYALYSSSCRAVKTARAGAVLSVLSDGFTVPTSSIPLTDIEHYVGGFATWESSGQTQRTLVSKVTDEGAFFRVFSDRIDMPPSVNMSFYKGCDRTESSCRVWHDNIVNFGGMSGIPDRNPVESIGEFV